MGENLVGDLAVSFIRLGASIYFRLPRRVQLGLGSLVGVLVYFSGYRQTVAKHNLSLAFPSQQGLQKKLLWQSYLHLGKLASEVLLLFGPLKSFVEDRVILEGIEHIKDSRRGGKGAILVSSHVGNWEIMAASGGLEKIDLMLVTKRLKPRWLHTAIERGRARCGVKATYEPRTFAEAMAHLRKNGALGVVLDQFAGPPVGIRVPLFGIPVGTSLVPAILSKRTGAPVHFITNFRNPDGSWSVRVSPALSWKQDENPHFELALNTAHYVSLIEKDILSYSDQWLWIHRRFKGDLQPLRQAEWHQSRVRR